MTLAAARRFQSKSVGFFGLELLLLRYGPTLHL
jgi:hypothetical protein